MLDPLSYGERLIANGFRAVLRATLCAAVLVFNVAIDAFKVNYRRYFNYCYRFSAV